MTPERKGLEAQLDQLRTKWPQAHAVRRKGIGDFAIFLPGYVLPKGWNKTICTVFWLQHLSMNGTKTGSPLDGFYVDLPDLRLAGGRLAHYSRPFALNDWKDVWHEATRRYWSTKEEIAGLPQWRELTRFFWRVQSWDPNRDTLYTSAMVIRHRLNPAR